jgi:Skp family chaperone for outer membrane proteins
MQGVLHVKVSHLAMMAAAVVCGSLVGSVPASALAQGARAPAGHNIAVVDVSVVFKQHARFLARTETFKKQVENAEAALKKEYEAINALTERLKGLQPGSADFKELEQRVVRAKADWQLKGQSQRRELMEEEGRIYFQTYRELDDAVKRFAVQNNIALVLRYASDPVDDPNDRNEIVKGINKSVVYVDPRLDITVHILQDLNRSGPPVSGGNSSAGPVGVGPRPGVQR